MPKFGKVYQTLLQSGLASLDQFHLPSRASRTSIALAHTPDYIDAYCNGTLDSRAMRRIGLPWSAALVNRTCTAVGGTILAAELATQHGIACNTAGGTHHAHTAFGSGFCIFNDLAIAARTLQQQKLARRVLIIDLDVHQGDGTAAIFAHDDTVFTFSMHCGANFPFRKQPSDLDIDMPVGSNDAQYMRTLAHTLPDLLGHVAPDLVLYDAGVDPHREDRLGKLDLTDAGILQRDKFVFDHCLRQGIPIATVVGGGYSVDINALARRHCLLYIAADETLYAHHV